MKIRIENKLMPVALLAFAVMLGIPTLTYAMPDRPARAQDSRETSDASRDSRKNRDFSERNRQEIKNKAQDRVEQIKARVDERRAEVKQKVCERKQAAIEKRLPRMSEGAVNVSEAFNTVYERVQGFYQDRQLTVENYEELNASVAKAQEEALVEVEALQEFEITVDCENPNLGEQLTEFREAAKSTREALHEYRENLVVLISAMRAEAAEKKEANSQDADNSEQLRSEEERSDDVQ